MEINLVLEEGCPVCSGSGTGWEGDKPIKSGCPHCGGRGERLTSEGEAVLALVRKYLAVELRPTVPVAHGRWDDGVVPNPLIKERR